MTKVTGEIVSVEFLRGGVRASMQLGQYGVLVLNGLTEEESKGMRAGSKVELDITVSAPVEEEKEEEATPEVHDDYGDEESGDE